MYCHQRGHDTLWQHTRLTPGEDTRSLSLFHWTRDLGVSFTQQRNAAMFIWNICVSGLAMLHNLKKNQPSCAGVILYLRFRYHAIHQDEWKKEETKTVTWSLHRAATEKRGGLWWDRRWPSTEALLPGRTLNFLHEKTQDKPKVGKGYIKIQVTYQKNELLFLTSETCDPTQDKSSLDTEPLNSSLWKARPYISAVR